MDKYGSVNVTAQEILDSIDEFVLGNKPSAVKDFSIPSVIDVRLFQSHRLLARIINRLAYVPLRIVRKSTTKYWNAQKQVDYNFSRELVLLKSQVKSLKNQIDEIKREANNDKK